MTITIIISTTTITTTITSAAITTTIAAITTIRSIGGLSECPDAPSLQGDVLSHPCSCGPPHWLGEAATALEQTLHRIAAIGDPQIPQLSAVHSQRHHAGDSHSCTAAAQHSLLQKRAAACEAQHCGVG